MEHFEKKLSGQLIYSGKVITVEKDQIQLENGKISVREVVRHSGATAVIAIDDMKNIIFVRQFRYPFGREMLEIPAGKLEPDESPLDCAKREMVEETGILAQKYIDLGKFIPSCGYCDEVIHLFGAMNLQQGESSPDEDEFVSTVKIPMSEAVDMIMRGEIQDGKTIAGVLKLKIAIEQENNT